MFYAFTLKNNLVLCAKVENLTKKAKDVELDALRIFGNLNNVKREACKK